MMKYFFLIVDLIVCMKIMLVIVLTILEKENRIIKCYYSWFNLLTEYQRPKFSLSLTVHLP